MQKFDVTECNRMYLCLELPFVPDGNEEIIIDDVLFHGLFYFLEQAEAACKTEQHAVVPMDLNVEDLDEAIRLEEAYFPLKNN